jgi:hypothetical protein
MAWIGFACGIVVLLATGSSVIKTLLIPRNLRSVIGNAVGQSVVVFYRVITARIEDLQRRERILACGAPTFLFTVLVAWIACLFVGYALVLLPFTHGGMTGALRLSGSSLFTLGFATPSGAAPYGIVFAAAISGLGAIALMIGYMPTIYAAYNRREVQVTMLEALAGKPPWGPELLARQQLIGNVSYLPRLYERWTEWAADVAESHTTYRTLIFFRSRYAENPWPLALMAVLDAAALQLSLCPDSAPAEARPLLRVGYVTMHQIAMTLGLRVVTDPHPDDPIQLTRAEFDEAIAHMDKAGWVFERKPEDAWPHFRGWRVNYEQSAYGIAAQLDLPRALWSGPRARFGKAIAPARPPHREPGQQREPEQVREPEQAAPQGDPSAVPTIPLSTCGNT